MIGGWCRVCGPDLHFEEEVCVASGADKERESERKGSEREVDLARGVDLAGGVDLARIAAAVREILVAVGENPDREGLADTPMRVARMYAELFAGLRRDPGSHLKVLFSEHYDELVVLRDIPFNSLCEHHLMPFEGVAHVAYLPNGKIAGISKLARVVDAFAGRPQVQERLTNQIADLLFERLDAKGVAVLLKATHTCMTCRGVKKPGSIMVTSALRGRCKSDARTRSEVMVLLGDTCTPR
jgi:GTP cyclohydrolase I